MSDEWSGSWTQWGVKRGAPYEGVIACASKEQAREMAQRIAKDKGLPQPWPLASRVHTVTTWTQEDE